MDGIVKTGLENSVLLQPEKWKVVVRGISEDVMPVKNDLRLSWSLEHAHAHPFRELLIVWGGDVYLGVHQQVYPCSPGMMFFFDQDEAHDHAYPKNSPDLDHIWIRFIKGAIFANFVSARGGKWFSTRSIDVEYSTLGIPDLSRPFQELWPAFESYSSEFKRFKLFTAIAQLIGFIIEQYNKPQANTNSEKMQRIVIERLCGHIDECAGRGVNLKDIARMAGYSKFHFHRMFEAHTGTTLHDYVNCARKQRVEDMLQEGCSKKEISYELGFSCPAAFSRWFKKHCLIV